MERLGEDGVHLSLDHFYRDLSHLPIAERQRVNFDDPEAIDWDSLRDVITSFERGEIAQVPVYNFAQHAREAESAELKCRPFVVVEGLWLLHQKWLREKFAISVFVECPEEMRLERRVKRDAITRGRTEGSIRKQFSEHVQPMHARFVEPQRALATHHVTSPLLEAELDQLLAACVA